MLIDLIKRLIILTSTHSTPSQNEWSNFDSTHPSEEICIDKTDIQLYLTPVKLSMVKCLKAQPQAPGHISWREGSRVCQWQRRAATPLIADRSCTGRHAGSCFIPYPLFRQARWVTQKSLGSATASKFLDVSPNLHLTARTHLGWEEGQAI